MHRGDFRGLGWLPRRVARRATRALRELIRRVTRPVRGLSDRPRLAGTPGAVVVEVDLDPGALRGAGHRRLYAGRQARFATCSDVLWTRPDRVITVHLLMGTICVYDFLDDQPAPRLVLRSQLRDPAAIPQPESLAGSPDGRWLAATHQTSGSVVLFAIDSDGATDALRVAAVAGRTGDADLHGIAFSPDSEFLVYTTIDAPGGLRIMRIHQESGALNLHGEFDCAR